MYFYENKGNELMLWKANYLAFPPHVHDHIELVYILSGSTSVSINFREYPLQKEDCIIIFPNQIHSYAKDKDLECCLVIFPTRYCEEFASIFQEKEILHPAISSIETTSEEAELLRKIFTCYEEKGPYHIEMAKGYLIAFLAKLLAQSKLRDKRTQDSFSVLQVLDYCQNNFQNDVTLETMSQQLKLSPTYLSHIMNDRLDMGFRDYINGLRIAEAERLLHKHSGTITEIAMQVGFNSTRSFNRVFKATLGMTPKQYMDENRL